MASDNRNWWAARLGEKWVRVSTVLGNVEKRVVTLPVEYPTTYLEP
ncbi:hypothetical protein COLO4_33747 [Corchorus olitorius]|uniref:Uncharacterized protein n=1 Tax=Corchorus olitorius TaxID=93759 RepID=A0A1R3GRS6_9ROSI|nr:hypothetical protein COLO4_33747 [Corchorus olitorius]